jgi:predicted AAA+ superfamily ATPase
LYFYDTGLACSLIGIESAQQVKTYYSKGALFENLVINEFMKNRLHQGKTPRLSFWQNKSNQELDLIIDHAGKPQPVEIKSGRTMQDSYFANLTYWKKLTGESSQNLHVVYGGDSDLKTSKGNYTSWKNLTALFR